MFPISAQCLQCCSRWNLGFLPIWFFFQFPAWIFRMWPKLKIQKFVGHGIHVVLVLMEKLIHCLMDAFALTMFLRAKNEQENCQKFYIHTTYSWNIKWQKCAGISGMWVLNEIIQKNMKKIVGAVWKCYLAGNFQTAPTIFFIFSGYFFEWFH